VEAIMIPIWARFFSDIKRREQQIRWMHIGVAGMRLLDAIMWICVFSPGYLDANGMLAIVILGRFFFSPFTYWRISAQAWAIDEYYHRTGVRQEAMFYGVHSLFNELGRGALAAGVFMIVLSQMEKREDCLEFCGLGEGEI
jgi:Na+/melibiose symporter-like transporter